MQAITILYNIWIKRAGDTIQYDTRLAYHYQQKAVACFKHEIEHEKIRFKQRQNYWQICSLGLHGSQMGTVTGLVIRHRMDGAATFMASPIAVQFYAGPRHREMVIVMTFNL